MILTFHYFPIQLGPLGIHYCKRSNLHKIVWQNNVIYYGDINLYSYGKNKLVMTSYNIMGYINRDQKSSTGVYALPSPPLT